MSDNKRIAKNTLFLYVRMFFLMGVTLYTSRVVLDKLGASDFGIYGAVGGIVGMLGFLNNTLSTGTSRFLTFELGIHNFEKLKSTFNTAFYTHLILALFIALFLETGGLWFLYNKLIIPEDRLFAAEWVLHISVLTTMVSITQVPYTSVIIAHENMSIYAYIGIFEACFKLLVVYLLSIASWDRLIYYAILIGFVQVVVALIYRYYCKKKYEESQLNPCFDKAICKEMMIYSGWGLIANIAQVLGTQGLIVVVNMFFSPVVVAAQTVANQVSNAIMHFINNFRTAINPQIIKLYASENYQESRRLTLESSNYVFDLLLLLGLPLIVIMKPLINLWLVEAPEYTVIFAQYTILISILGNWSTAFYVPMMASGELKWNSYASVLITFLGFAILYGLFVIGMSVMWVQWISVVQACAYSFVVKPYILCWKIGYSWSEMANCFFTAIKISILPILASIFTMRFVSNVGLVNMLISATIPAIAVVISAYINLDKNTRGKLLVFVHRIFNRHAQ